MTMDIFIESQEDLLSLVMETVPYADQILDVDLTSEGRAIRFSWRGGRYRITRYCFVEEVEDGILKGSREALLFQALLRFHASVKMTNETFRVLQCRTERVSKAVRLFGSMLRAKLLRRKR